MADENSNARSAFGLGFDIEPDEADPQFGEEGALSVDSGAFLPNEDGVSEFLPPDPDKVPRIEHAMKQDSDEYRQRPAEERTRELLAYMRPHRTVLLGIIDAASQRIGNQQIVERIDQLRAHKFSVYDPTNLCTMLEQAGALEQVTEDGQPYRDYQPQPDIVIEDGIEYYVPTNPPAVHWQATEAGLAALAENNPEERLERLFVTEAEFLPIYKSVLEMLAAEEGAAMTALSGAIDNIEAIAQPRRFFVQHFVENLERCEAAQWNGKRWQATAVGLAALEGTLADVDAAETTPVNADGTLVNQQDEPHNPYAKDGRLRTETQGVNW